jgi:hypothetical protein
MDDLRTKEKTKEQLRKARHDAIAAYAAEMAGTEFDLDAQLEAAGIEHWVSIEPERS